VAALVRPDTGNAARVYRALVAFGAPVDAHGIRPEDFASPGAVYQMGLPPRRCAGDAQSVRYPATGSVGRPRAGDGDSAVAMFFIAVAVARHRRATDGCQSGGATMSIVTAAPRNSDDGIRVPCDLPTT
jgi:hypothetical protein